MTVMLNWACISGSILPLHNLSQPLVVQRLDCAIQWIIKISCHWITTTKTTLSDLERFSSKEPKPKQLLRPITTGANRAMNQSQFLAITCNSLKAREESRVHGAIGFGLASHWLKNWRKSFKSITKRSNPIT